MKRVTFIIIILYTLVVSAQAQEPRFIFDRDSLSSESPEIPQTTENELSKNIAPKVENDSTIGDSMRFVLPPMPSWRINAITGNRIPTPVDTSFIGFNQQSLVDGQGVAVGYLGNWGSAAQSKIFFERPESSQFNFLNPFSYYYQTPQNHLFLDTKVPYSNITYESGGGAKTKEERFMGAMSLSFNKHFTLGFNLDYVYARGFYPSLSTKQNSYDIFATYITDKYEMKAFFANNNYVNLENGGLNLSTLNDNYFDQKSTELPVMYSNTWNKLRGRTLYMTHKYSVGYYNDDEEDNKFVPVASAFFTTNYTDQRRTFTTRDLSTLDELYSYKPTGITVGTASSDNSDTALNDYMSYYSFKNSLGISLNEGFKPWVKFGLTGYVEQDIRKYLMSSYINPSLARTEYSQNSTTLGGILSKTKGDLFRYNLSASLGLIGYNQGESVLKADISSTIKIKNKAAVITANAYVKNQKPTFFENNFSSRYYQWSDDKNISQEYGVQYTNFSDIKRVFVGGEIYIPHTKTKLSGGVENIKNYIYYTRASDINANTQIMQDGSNLQVISLRLEQKLNAGILHFDNQIVYQKSSNKEVLPLPDLSLYSNLYILFKVAKVLDVQLGVDAHYNTKYYAPGYDPALLQFYNQSEREIGNYPMATAYANLHLKKTRFYVMMYNAAQDLVNTPYLDLNGYAYNPMVFKFGLSWNFAD